ncbi:MAG: proteasome activator [Acidimicrobiia bacterium]
MDESVRPDAIETEQTDDPAPTETEQPVSEPTKLIRMASMTRAMLDEVRHAPLDEGGKNRLAAVHARSIEEMRGVLSPDLLEEFDGIMIPLRDDDKVTEPELRIAQAQLIGWLEGLFHGIQASLWTQQMAAQSQLAEMQRRSLKAPEREDGSSGLYL